MNSELRDRKVCKDEDEINYINSAQSEDCLIVSIPSSNVNFHGS